MYNHYDMSTLVNTECMITIIHCVYDHYMSVLENTSCMITIICQPLQTLDACSPDVMPSG